MNCVIPEDNFEHIIPNWYGLLSNFPLTGWFAPKGVTTKI